MRIVFVLLLALQASTSLAFSFKSTLNPSSPGPLPNIGDCSGTLPPPQANSATSNAISNVNLAQHLAEPIATKLPRYRSFRLGDKFADGEHGSSAPEVKLVADFNNDGLDDVLIEYYETNVPLSVYLSQGNGQFVLQQNMPLEAGRRHIRNAATADLNNDGWLDIAGFTTGDPYKVWALNGFKGKKSAIPRGEKDLLLINMQGHGFRVVDIPEIRVNDWNHGGAVGDIDGDGLIDILPLSEGENERTEPLRNTGNEVFELTKQEYSRPISYFATSDMEVADLNNDGHQDIVVAVQDAVDDGKPRRDVGSVHIIYGDGDFNFKNNTIIRIGDHWLAKSTMREFKKKRTAFTANERGLDSALHFGPTNIELIDVDGDGLKDIITGFFVSPYIWKTSGFTLLKNHGDCFSDETDQYFPNQLTNRHFEPEQTTGYIHNVFQGDINADGFTDIVLQMDSAQQWDNNPYDFHPNFFINNGNNQYLPVHRDTVPIPTRADFYSLGDVNGDGAVDTITLETNNNGTNNLVVRLQLTDKIRGKAKQKRLEVIAENRTRLKENAKKIRKAQAEEKRLAEKAQVLELAKQQALQQTFISALSLALSPALSSSQYRVEDGHLLLQSSAIQFVADQKPLPVKKYGFDLVNNFIRGHLAIAGIPLTAEVTQAPEVSKLTTKFEILASLIDNNGSQAVAYKTGDSPFADILLEPLQRARSNCGAFAKPDDWVVIRLATNDRRLIKQQTCLEHSFTTESEDAKLLLQILVAATPSIKDYLLQQP